MTNGGMCCFNEPVRLFQLFTVNWPDKILLTAPAGIVPYVFTSFHGQAVPQPFKTILPIV